jgi:hypothetical protein
MIRKAKINNARIVKYDLCSQSPIPNNKQKQLVLLGVGVIDSINGIKQRDDVEMYFYANKKDITTLPKKNNKILNSRYLNTREYRVETLVDIKAQMIHTDYGKIHKDYFNEFYELIDNGGM